MDAIVDLAGRHDLSWWKTTRTTLRRYRGRYLGTFGRLAAQSFHETKNFSCGEGGALIVNDPALVERAKSSGKRARIAADSSAGRSTSYSWIDVGSSYLRQTCWRRSSTHNRSTRRDSRAASCGVGALRPGAFGRGRRPWRSLAVRAVSL